MVSQTDLVKLHKNVPETHAPFGYYVQLHFGNLMLIFTLLNS